MGLVLIDSPYADRVRVSRPTSPGPRLWWVRLRGALAQLAASARSGEQGSTANRPAVLPALYEPALCNRSAYLDALGRTTDRVALLVSQQPTC